MHHLPRVGGLPRVLGYLAASTSAVLRLAGRLANAVTSGLVVPGVSPDATCACEGRRGRVRPETQP